MKAEVRGLEYAASNLLFCLELLTRQMFDIPLLNIAHGFHILSCHTSLARQDVITVQIRPVGWPKRSYICADFMREGRMWVAVHEGYIQATHLEPVLKDLMPFEITGEGLGVRIGTRNPEQYAIVSAALGRLSRWAEYEMRQTENNK